MSLDELTTAVGLLSFGIFLLVHVLTIRWVRPEHLLRSLLAAVLVLLTLPLVMMAYFYARVVVQAPLLQWLCAAGLAALMQGLLCFFYVICIFGPYETSVRMRLLREIANAPGGISEKDLWQRYNHETLLNLRLRRLTGSGDIIEKDGRYHAGRQGNVFFIFDAIASVLKKWIGR